MAPSEHYAQSNHRWYAVWSERPPERRGPTRLFPFYPPSTLRLKRKRLEDWAAWLPLTARVHRAPPASMKIQNRSCVRGARARGGARLPLSTATCPLIPPASSSVAHSPSPDSPSPPTPSSPAPRKTRTPPLSHLDTAQPAPNSSP